MSPGQDENPLRPFLSLIRDAKSFLVTTHVMPDGDGLGSQAGLCRGLRKLGKVAHAINSGPTPEKFRLVDPHSEIKVFDGQIPDVDVIFVVDTCDSRMLGPMDSAIRGARGRLVYIDHHVPEEGGTDGHLIDESFASTGELVFVLLRALGVELDPEIAIALYVALITDTGGFRFKRTNARSHRIAAELLEHGVEPEAVYRRIYAHESIHKLRLLGHVLGDIRFDPEGRVAWAVVTDRMRRHFGATIEDTESFINALTLLQGIEIGALFREEEDGRIKVSLRGNGRIPVVDIARRFGGGGHRYAAGMKLSLPLLAAIDSVLAEVRRVLAE